MGAAGQPLDHPGQHAQRVAAHPGGGVGGGVVGGPVEAVERLGHGRRARAQPGADGRVGDVERLGVDADAGGHRHGRGGQRRRARPAQLGGQRHRGVRRAGDQRLAAAPLVAAAVGVQVQGEARTRADVHQGEGPAGVGRDGRDRGQQPRAAGGLAHLVPVGGGQRQQVVGAGEAEVAQRGGEVRRQRRLGAAWRRQGGREPRRALPLDQRHRRRGEEQRRQPVGVDPRRQRQQVGVVAQRREQGARQRPRRRRVVARPRRREPVGLLADRLPGRVHQ